MVKFSVHLHRTSPCLVWPSAACDPKAANLLEHSHSVGFFLLGVAADIFALIAATAFTVLTGCHSLTEA